ncbi:aminomethyl-transferring glycine dehydrogenase subunit GcvPA [Ruminococcaceae bacterium OttesenSCG-928-I18]|nr:aminomethyl-transferring glycine dehydrogenase subunit GcvPA [Ruminococcaceae bacterium OttesenSCG-928-I18]
MAPKKTHEQFVSPYVPSTAKVSKEAMMKEIGIKDDMELYRDIPDDLIYKEDLDIPAPYVDEFSIQQHMTSILKKNANATDYAYFLGAGCARHHTPAVCDEMTGRGEFLTAYFGATTDDRGKWQAIWEYQAQMAELLDTDFCGFPQYDGPWSLSHAILIATRITGKRKVLVPASASPMNMKIVDNYTDGVTERQAELVEVAYDKKTGLLDLKDLEKKLDNKTAAVVIENPNFFGMIETQGEQIGKMAKKAGAEFIVYADPISLGVLEAPANYGANMAAGDLHSLGGHLAAGGHQAGFLGLPDDKKYLSQFKDLAVSIAPTIEDGEYSFVWYNFEEGSYGAREEANEFTGSACNLWAIHSAVYLTIMGPKGMEEVGNTIMARAQYAAAELAKLPGVKVPFAGPFFKEFVVDFTGTGKTVAEINRALVDKKIIGGLDLSCDFPELGQSALWCVTECNTQAEIDMLVAALEAVLA